MATANTTASASVRCYSLYNGRILTVQSHTGRREGKPALVMDLRKFDDLNDVVGSPEDLLLGRLTGEAIPGVEDTVELTRSEIALLVALRDRLSPPAAPPAPVPPPAPIVAPEPVQTAPMELRRYKQTAAQATVQRTGTRENLVSPNDPELAQVHEREIARLQATLERCKGGFRQVNYYVPQSVTPAQFPSPCGFLRSLLCVHFDGSNWFATEKAIQSPEFEAWVAEGRSVPGVRIWITRYHPEEAGMILDQIREQLREAIISVHTSLIERIASAADRLAEARTKLDERAGAHLAAWREQENAPVGTKIEVPAEPTDKELDAPVAAQDRDTLQVIRSAEELLAYAIRAAEEYDATEQVSDLLDGLRAAIQAEIEGFDGRAEESGRKPYAERQRRTRRVS